MAYQTRETVESARALGERALLTIGAEPEAAEAVMAEVRRRDAERLDLTTVGGVYAGLDLVRGNAAVPARTAG